MISDQEEFHDNTEEFIDMPWSVERNPSLEIIEEVFTGFVTAQELREATSQRISLQKETGITNILNDVSAFELDVTLMDVFDFPHKQYPEQGADIKTRMALIMPKCNKAREVAKFFITASLNRGWVVVPFEERQGATDWLLGKTTAANRV